MLPNVKTFQGSEYFCKVLSVLLITYTKYETVLTQGNLFFSCLSCNLQNAGT